MPHYNLRYRDDLEILDLKSDDRFYSKFHPVDSGLSPLIGNMKPGEVHSAIEGQYNLINIVMKPRVYFIVHLSKLRPVKMQCNKGYSHLSLG